LSDFSEILREEAGFLRISAMGWDW